jgi:serine/threonine protein kinase
MVNGTLEERLARERQLTPKEAVRIGAALAREVERLHRSGKRPCPIGPGLVTLRGNQVLLSEDGASAFPSPEEVAGRPADERTDVYRLGAIMYQMLTGSTPPEPVASPRIISTAPRLRPPAPPPSVHAVRRDVNRALDAAITRALSRDPQDRFARAIHFADVLDESVNRMDHEPHSDRPSQMMIVDSWEFQEEERRAERRTRRQSTERKAVLLLVVLSGILAAVVLL